MSASERTGSYPFKYIAEDFKLPYWVVLTYSDACKAYWAARDANVRYDADAHTKRALMVIKAKFFNDSHGQVSFEAQVRTTTLARNY